MATRDISRTRAAAPDPEAAEVPSSRAKRQSAGRAASGGTDTGTSGVKSGWGAFKDAKSRASKYNAKDEFKIKELNERYYGKFLDDGPFAVYTQHFFKGRPDKQAFICCEDCPVCAIGVTPTVYAVFRVLDLSGAEPAVKYWRCTPGPAGQIEEFEEEGPINAYDRYFVAFKRESKSGFNEFTVKEVPASKLNERAGVEPFTAVELDNFAEVEFPEDTIAKSSTRSELRALAMELQDEDE